MKTIIMRCKYALCVALAVMLAVTMVACNNDSTPTPTPEPTIKVTINDNGVSTIKEDETVTLTVTVENTDNKEVMWTSSDPTILKVTDQGVVSIVKEPDLLDKTVTITATSKEDKRVSATKTFTVKAKKRDGASGYLEDKMIYAIGGDNITVSGVINDIYEDTNNPDSNDITTYDFQVKMEDGKWSGAWGHHDPLATEPVLSITNTYVKGDTDGVKDEYGRSGHGIYEIHLDKHNQVARKAVVNYTSIPSVWEYQHYWNHISSLPAEEFTYDGNLEEPLEYTYTVDETNEDSLYLMAYLAFSLTPILTGDDTFQRVMFTLEADAESGEYSIAGMKAQTFASYVNPQYSQTGTLTGYDARQYTTCEFTFTNIGSTTVGMPAPYEASENTEKLQAALNKMKTADNYSYKAVDTTTSAPSSDPGDYEINSSATAGSFAAARATDPATTLKNYTSGTSPIDQTAVGTYGRITADAILTQNVSKYSFTSDGKDYRVEYAGYKQISTGGTDDYYEEFAYASDAIVENDGTTQTKIGAMKGTKSVYGHIADILPKFDFSPNLFKYNANRSTNSTLVFELQETSIMRDIAMEVSMYRYATDASVSATRKFTITIDNNGNLVSTSYPYSITQGTYLGYVTTTYSAIGTTTLPADTFNNYVPRGWKQAWSEYNIKYYDDENGNRIDPMNADTAARSIFGSNYAYLPTPGDFQKLFGDDMGGPFYDTRSKAQADGNEKLIRYMSITARSSEYDENSIVTNFDEIKETADALFTGKGYSINKTYTDVSGGKSGRSNRYLVYDNTHITIVIENNFTKNFWIYIYNSGDYSRTLDD